VNRVRPSFQGTAEQLQGANQQLQIQVSDQAAELEEARAATV